MLASIGSRLEYILSTRDILLHRLGVIVADSGVGLLEVDIDGDRFHIVQRILLIERETEFSFGVKLRSSNVLLRLHGVVMSRADIYIGVILKLISGHLESISPGHEAIEVPSFRLGVHGVDLIRGDLVIVGAWTWFSVEVLLQVKFGIEPSLLRAKLLLSLEAGTCIGEGRET